MGSMNLAITLLVAVALSSIIGTLLKQNESYQSYIIKFGPFWHEVYLSLGLYDVYSSAWFIGILSFLVITTSICITQNGPGILRSMQRFRELISAQSLRTMKQHEEWHCDIDIDKAYKGLCYFLKKSGYRLRTHENEQGYTLAAMHGASNRLGYILTHVAIVVICLGGLIDGNLPLKFKTLTGQLRIEKDNNARVSEIPDASILSIDNPSFRASVTIPEGKTVSVAFQNIADGYLVQRLPFSIEVVDFRIEHYESGQPKSFESDLIIHDPEADTPIVETISVNLPLSYKGYTIYQASFTDGGSQLDMLLHKLRDNDGGSLEISGHINETLSINTICEYLLLADRHNAQEVRYKSLLLLKEEKHRILQSPEWKIFGHDYPLIVTTILTTILSDDFQRPCSSLQPSYSRDEPPTKRFKLNDIQ